MEILKSINTVIGAVFLICYLYQFAYIPISFFKRKKPNVTVRKHRFAVLISARNEENVISNLIDSIKNQSYPPELIEIFVVADNCTDSTAEVARAAGAAVFERSDTVRVGKGYAIDWLLAKISDEHNRFDAFAVFDADNVLDPNWFTEMNKTLCDGNHVITGYRNSKNYGSNWISAGYALWFIRESRFLNQARMFLGTSCTIGGTGFVFSKKILEKIGGWPFHLLTEDLEFTTWLVINGYKVAYCKDAVVYDEQPTSFKQSWHQRMRWSRGFLQIMFKYGRSLVKSIFSERFSSAYDVTMTLAPAYFLTVLGLVTSIAALIYDIVRLDLKPLSIAYEVAGFFFGIYIVMFIIGAITTAAEWKHIYCSAPRKILYVFTFPLFMITYIPIAIAALFTKVEWKPICHTQAKSLEEITSGVNRG